MTERPRTPAGGRRARLRDALLAIPLFAIVGVLAGEASSSPIVTVGSLLVSAAAIGLYLGIEWKRSRGGG